MTTPPPRIRRELHAGDLGEIIAHHGNLYASEFELDSVFEAHVAASVSAAGSRGFPRPGEGIWIVESGGAHRGSLALTDEGEGAGAVRWFVLDPDLRGSGIGRRLLAELLELARAGGLERLWLETFSDLRAAAHLYRSSGFQLVSEQTGPRWGRAELTYQRYELTLQSRAQSRSSVSTGPRARPISVSS